MSDKRKHRLLIGVAVLGGLTLMWVGSPTTTNSNGISPQARSWAQAVMPELKTTVESMQNMGSGCGAGNVYRCTNSTVAVSTNVKRTLQVMAANPAPRCLSNTESGLKTALQTIDASTGLLLDGVLRNDVSGVQSATRKIDTVAPMFDSLKATLKSELVGCTG